eukprot:m.33618 g.33618  ORF g.33618 m.33618 type:complete len:917 (+) comp6460_c0_seq3:1791-4541(+)
MRQYQQRNVSHTMSTRQIIQNYCDQLYLNEQYAKQLQYEKHQRLSPFMPPASDLPTTTTGTSSSLSTSDVDHLPHFDSDVMCVPTKASPFSQLDILIITVKSHSYVSHGAVLSLSLVQGKINSESQDETEMLRVDSVAYSSPLHAAGLRGGDYLLAINHTILMEKDIAYCLNQLHNTKGDFFLIVAREDPQNKPKQLIHFELRNVPKSPPIVSLQGRPSFVEENKAAVVVKRVKTAYISVQDGHKTHIMQPGDIVLYLNGMCFIHESSMAEVPKALDGGNNLSMTVIRPLSSRTENGVPFNMVRWGNQQQKAILHAPTPHVPFNEAKVQQEISKQRIIASTPIRQVTLCTSEIGYGLHVLGPKHEGDNPGIFVLDTAPDSPSAVCGRIFAGDRILNVNGVDVVGHSHNDMLDLIKNTRNITLVLAHDPVTCEQRKVEARARVSETKRAKKEAKRRLLEYQRSQNQPSRKHVSQKHSNRHAVYEHAVSPHELSIEDEEVIGAVVNVSSSVTEEESKELKSEESMQQVSCSFIEESEEHLHDHGVHDYAKEGDQSPTHEYGKFIIGSDSEDDEDVMANDIATDEKQSFMNDMVAIVEEACHEDSSFQPDVGGVDDDDTDSVSSSNAIDNSLLPHRSKPVSQASSFRSRQGSALSLSNSMPDRNQESIVARAWKEGNAYIPTEKKLQKVMDKPTMRKEYVVESIVAKAWKDRHASPTKLWHTKSLAELPRCIVEIHFTLRFNDLGLHFTSCKLEGQSYNYTMVSKVQTSSAAGVTNQISPGDIIVEVNGKEVAKMRHTVIVTMINNCAEDARVKLSSFTLGVVKQNNLIRIEEAVIQKHPTHSYGIGLSSHLPCVIQAIREESFALDANVRVGDEVIQVNGHNVENCTVTEIVDLINHGTPQTGLSLLLKRRADLVVGE